MTSRSRERGAFSLTERATYLAAHCHDNQVLRLDVQHLLAFPTRHDFDGIVQKAGHRHREARADFVKAGGETLLGPEAERSVPF